jgi:hypothetical protein
MDSPQMTTDSELVWLTDKEGNCYLIRREAIEAHRVPEEVQAEVKSLIEEDVSGYGEGNWLLQGVLDHMGLKLGDEKFDASFDLDADGDTDWDDYHMAKKHWYEQYGDKTVPPGTS